MFVCLCSFWRGGENWIKPHCACIPCFKSPSFCLWTPGMIPKFGCREWNCNKIDVYVVLWGVYPEFSNHTPITIIALYGNTLFSFLEKLYLFPQWLTFILTRRIILGVGAPSASLLLTPRTGCLLLVLTVKMMQLSWNPSAAGFCISLIVKDAEQLFKCLLTICTSYFENWLLILLVHQVIKLSKSLVFNFLGYLYILDIDPLLWHFYIVSKDFLPSYKLSLNLITCCIFCAEESTHKTSNFCICQ